ncbi:MAG: hypothetical protein AAGB15_11025, partial [Pseudomonadota bacterium]
MMRFIATFRRVLPVIALILGLWTMAATEASAQVISYDQLFGGQTEEQSSPQQSRPVQPSQNRTPTAADYGVVADTADGQMLNVTREAVSVFRARLAATVRRLPGSIEEINQALAAASPTGRASYFLGIALFAGLLLVIGRSVALIFATYVARPIMVSFTGRERRGYLGKLPVLATRLAMTIAITAIAIAVATAVGLLFYQEHEQTLITVIIVFAAFGTWMTVDTVWRMAVAPYFSEFRLPKIDDRQARSLYGWLSSISAMAVVSMAFVDWMSALGVSQEVFSAFTVVLSLVLVVAVLAMFRVQQKTIATIILAGRTREEA